MKTLLSSALFLAIAFSAQSLFAQTGASLEGAIEIDVQARQTIDRTSGRIRSTLELGLENTGARTVGSPLHLVLDLVSEGSLAEVSVDGDVLGGFDAGPYDSHYFDLSALVPGGLAAGAQLDFTISFDRPSDVVLTYGLRAFGTLNRDPVADGGGPYAGEIGATVQLDASGSSDPDGDALSYEWDFGEGPLASGESINRSFASPGTYEAILTVRDGRGGVSARAVAVSVVPTDAFALGRIRTLDGVGHPFPSVRIEESGPGGDRNFESSELSGFASLGGDPGSYIWSFSYNGYLTVYHVAELEAGLIRGLPSPWLTELSPQNTVLKVTEDVVLRDFRNDSLTISFPRGRFASSGTGGVTGLNAQALPLPLPPGWSPLQAFDLRLSVAPIAAGTAELTLWDVLTVGETASWLRFDRESLTWVVVENYSALSGETVDLPVSESGTFVLAVPDTGATAPPAAVIDAALEGVASTPADLSAITVEGSLNPETSAASANPLAVTTQATAVFSSASEALPSGTAFATSVQESYDLVNGDLLATPSYDQNIRAYRRPGTGLSNELSAVFPVRPQLLFDAQSLNLATVQVSLKTDDGLSRTAFDRSGGQLADNGVVLTLPADAADNLAAAELRSLGLEGFAAFTGDFNAIRAFELNLPDIGGDVQIGFSMRSALAPNAYFVLARLASIGTTTGLVPVQRFATDGNSVFSSMESQLGGGLPGIRGSGQYVLLQVDAPRAVVSGTIRDGEDATVAGVTLRVDGEPWLVESAVDGGYFSLAPAGEQALSARDTQSGDGATASITVAGDWSALSQDLVIGPIGPRVVEVTPEDGAASVDRVAPVRVRFSEAINAETFGVAGVLLEETESGSLVSASVLLNIAGTEARLLPSAPLAYDTAYEIIVSEAITDLTEDVIEGPLRFAFTTEEAAARGAGGQFVIYEPGAENVPQEVLDDLVGYVSGQNSSMVICSGSQGTADPEVPLILVNETTGATATVLSKPDGSFANFIDADEADFVAATFINQNGTRIRIPASRQLFDDGSVGLYSQGGILEAESDGGPVEVFIEPEAIETRTKFKLDAVNLLTLLQLLQGSLPEGAELLGGFVASHENSAGVEGEADAAFSIAADNIPLPSGITQPENGSFVLTSLKEIDGQLVYEQIDTMHFEEDGLETASPPFEGIIFKKLLGKVTGSLRSFKELGKPNQILNALGLPSFQDTITHQLLLPVLLSQGTTTTVYGNVTAQRYDIEGEKVGEPLPVEGAVIGMEKPPLTTPGKLRAGQVVAKSRADGQYALKINVGGEFDAFFVAATHPRFFGTRALASGDVGNLQERFFGNGSEAVIPNFVKVDLEFPIYPAEDATLEPDEHAPVIRPSHLPGVPVAGTDSEDGAKLVVLAIDDRNLEGLDLEVVSAITAGGRRLYEGEGLNVIDEGEIRRDTTRLERRFTIQVEESARVELSLFAADAEGNFVEVPYAIEFNRQPLIPGGGDGSSAPRVTSTYPPPNTEGFVSFPEIQLRFSKPMPDEAFELASASWLTFSSGHYPTAILRGSDPSEMRIQFAGAAGVSVGVSVGTPLTDATGNAFDQNPGEEGTQSYSWSFGLGSGEQGSLDLQTGGGVEQMGSYLLALDRTSSNELGQLVAYDLSDSPLQPERVAELALPATPADLEILQGISLQRGPNAPCENYDLAAVVGGSYGIPGDGDAGAGGFKYLWLVDVRDRDPAFAGPSLELERFASGNVSFDPNSAIVKVRAADRFLAYLEWSADLTSLHVVDLQAFVMGHNATDEERAAFPLDYRPGLDLNGDGDTCDAGEFPSLPSKAPATYPGEIFSFAPFDANNRYVDFDFGGSRALLGVVTRNLTTGNFHYRNLLEGSSALNGSSGILVFNPGELARRLKILESVRVRVDGVIRVIDLALVSMVSPANEGFIAVLDLSDPAKPVRLGDMPMAPGDGLPQSVELREDGALLLATTNSTLTLEPLRLLETDSEGRSLAILSRSPDSGGGVRSFVASASGLTAQAARGLQTVGFTGPDIDVVTLPSLLAIGDAIQRVEFPLNDPATIAYTPLFEEEVFDLVENASSAPLLRSQDYEISEDPVADVRAVTTVPETDDHYYVLCRLPGGASGKPRGPIDLTVASLNTAGGIARLSAPGVLPRLLIDPATRQAQLGDEIEGAYPLSLQAWPVTNDTTSPYYDVFLAGPIALHQSLSASHASALAEQFPRTFIRKDRFVYIGLAPAGARPNEDFLNPFRPRVMDGALSVAAGELLETDSVRGPLIFVPGVMASRLRADPSLLQNNELWLEVIASGLQQTGIFAAYSRLKNLVLAPDGSGPPVFPSDILRTLPLTEFLGFQIKAKILEPIQIQQPLIDYLVQDMGYREYQWDPTTADPDFFRIAGSPNWESLQTQPDLFPFPYDWRKDNAENAERLKEYIDLILEVHPEAESVDVIAHSMGGLISRRVTLDHPGLIDRLITVCSPFLGAPKSLISAKTGDLDDFGLNVLLPRELSLGIGRYMPALHQLMPSEGFFELGGHPLIEAGWDGDEDGNRFEALDYAGYRSTIDGGFMDVLPSTVSGTLDIDFVTPVAPIAANNEPFHHYGVPGDNQTDWSGSADGSSFFHIVGVQQKPSTISQVELLPRLVPITAPTDVGISLSPVAYRDSDMKRGLVPILPDADAKMPLGNDFFRYEQGVRVKRGIGDGTVPILSQARGYGSTLDLNAPGAIVYPLVSTGTSDEEDDAYSHVGVLANPELHKLLDSILTGGALPPGPKLTIEMATDAAPQVGDAVEGETVTFSVNIAGGGPGQARVVWDAGDGGQGYGESFTHTYRDNGRYMVTCSVAMPGMSAALTSRRIEVEAADPVINLLASDATITSGQEVRFYALPVNDRSSDHLLYSWNFGDGVSTEPSEDYQLSHRFYDEGNHLVSVTAFDDDGRSSTSELTVAVGEELPSPLALRSRSVASAEAEGVGFEQTGAPVAYIEVVGHDNSTGSPLVTTGSGRALTLIRQAAFDTLGIKFETYGDRAAELVIYRAAVQKDEPLPDATTARFVSVGGEMSVKAVLSNNANVIMGHLWKIDTVPGQKVTFTIPWNDIFGATPGLESMMVPPAKSVVPSLPQNRIIPQLIVKKNATQAGYTIVGEDAEPSGLGENVESLVEKTEVFAVMSPALEDTSEDPIDSTEELTTISKGSIVRSTEPGPIVEGTEITDITHVITVDSGGALVESENLATLVDEAPTLERSQVLQIRQAIEEVIRLGAFSPFFNKFVIARSDLIFLEQGSGANLWKDEPRKWSAYTPRASDNDIEIFLPVFKEAANRIPESAAEEAEKFEAFPKVAHLAEYIQGDWYFKRPVGIDSSGAEMAYVPDPDDPEQYGPYVDHATAWLYKLPRGLGNLDGDSESFTITKTPGVPPFNHPVTPGEVLSWIYSEEFEALLAAAEADSSDSLEELMSEVSFFPVRWEHFFFGVPSLDPEVPPFGDDTVGDAGLGRGLLLTKWAMEGVFLPPVYGHNEQAFLANEADFRDTVFARMSQRSDELAIERYEWGVLQEWALLDKGGNFLLHNTNENRGVKAAFGDFTTERQDKILRAAGKAITRGVMAVMVADETARNDFFSLAPSAFDADASLQTFEHYVIEVGKRHLHLMNGLTATDLDRFLRAKVGAASVFEEIRSSEGGIAGYLEQAFAFLESGVHTPAIQDYLSALEVLRTQGLRPERRLRIANLRGVDYAAPTRTGAERPGRWQLLGQEPGFTKPFDFGPITLFRSGPDLSADAGPFEITLLTDVAPSPLVAGGLVIPANEQSINVRPTIIDMSNMESLLFQIAYSPADSEIKDYDFLISEGLPTDDSFTINNAAHLESRYLDLQESFAPGIGESADRKVVFRGLSLTDEEWAGFEMLELQRGELFPPSTFNAIQNGDLSPNPSDAEVDVQLAADRAATLQAATSRINELFAGGSNSYEEFVIDRDIYGEMATGADLDYRLALWHVGGGGKYGISTAEKLATAIGFSEPGASLPKKPYLLAIEVDADAGIEYLPMGLRDSQGRTVFKRANDIEGNEVIFLGRTPFYRVDVYRVVELPGLQDAYDLQFLNTYTGRLATP